MPGGAHAPNLVPSVSTEGAASSEGFYDFVPKLLGGPHQSVALHLRFGPLDNEPGTIGRVVGYQLLFLSDLRGQRGDKAFFLDLGGDATPTFGIASPPRSRKKALSPR